MSLTSEQRRLVEASDRQFRPTLRDRITRFGELPVDASSTLVVIIFLVVALVAIGGLAALINTYAAWVLPVLLVAAIISSIVWAVRYFIRQTNDA